MSNSSKLRNLNISFVKIVGNFNANSLNGDSKMLNGIIDGSKSPLLDHSNDVTIAPQPTLKGNYVGDTPWKLVDLRMKLQSLWNLPPSWRLISFGKDFFHILLNLEEEKNHVWPFGSLNLKPGVLRFQPWHPNFNPNT
ncbi:hypothetical protein TorRG33x02_126580 [Trema orientale]|uniref:DUF4283 domain-containing protein n=1 Tax=Trema orientale TaxID=63057 RepID=A0A2P5F1H3_TREOI|nr:hypothetical protein TorRG33x02_126580 [Trema orientale]